jgi:hypothetical protein
VLSEPIGKEELLTKLTILPTFDYQDFPFFLALKETKVMIVNCVTGKMFTLIKLRQASVDCELADF